MRVLLHLSLRNLIGPAYVESGNGVQVTSQVVATFVVTVDTTVVTFQVEVCEALAPEFDAALQQDVINRNG